MSLEAISSAATIALASTVLILLAVKLCRKLAHSFDSVSHFPQSIMVESAQRFRDELERLEQKKTLSVTLSLMFIVTFGVSILLRPQDTFGALPTWQGVVVLTAVAIASLYGLYRVIRIFMDRRRVAFIRDANIAIGHGLQKLTANQNRVFHEVPCTAGFIDDVVVSLQGVYAVTVIARRPGKDNRIQLNEEELSFAPGKVTLSVANCGLMAKQLAKALGSRTGREICVRPVVAVPGWEIASQASEKYLIVNERSLAMMQGWKNEKDYLMTEDVEAINAYLSEYGTRSSRRS